MTIEFVESSDGGRWSVRPKTGRVMQHNSAAKSVWCNFTVTVQNDDEYGDEVQSDQADEDYQAALTGSSASASSFYPDDAQDAQDADDVEDVEDEDLAVDETPEPSTPWAAQPRPPAFTRPKKMDALVYLVKPAGSTVAYKCPADGETLRYK